MKTFFCNRTVDKGEMKRLIKWVLLNYGTEKTTRLIDQLKTMGFHYATHAGLSLGIDDLRIPPIKSTFLKNADQDIYENDLRLQRGQITSVQRLEKALDIWNTTNDTLKTEVIKYFRATDIFNPVYMMAFSGARGNISQVRQLVGMRGLMADPQGQVLDFPIRRNFREGLTVTEYMISCYGARKGLVDTALRTASSGYLTRRLVDVAQSVIIQQVDCHTTQGLQIIPNAKQMDSQLIGRVLFDNVIDVETGRIIGYKNQDISPALALKLVKQPTLTIRSPLTCKFHAVCQLCYGWNLAQQKLVQLGEAVGVLAAQSIGEPGTQLTMRTFHTGGVFAGEVTEKVYSPHAGTVFYSVNMRGRKVLSKYGEIAFLTFEPIQIKVKNLNQTSILNFPALSLLYVAPGQVIEAHQSLAELSRIEVKRKMMQFDQEAENLRKEFTASQSGQIFLPQRYRSLSTSFGISQVSNYTEMWLLGGFICNSQELIPGDKMNLISHPMSWKSLNTPGKVQPKILVDSFMSRTNRTNRDLSDMDRYFLTNFQLTDKTNLSSDTLTFIRNYYLELNNSVSTAIGEKACSFTPVNLSVSFKFKALQFAFQKLLAMQTTATKGYRNKTVSKFSVYSKLKLSRLTKYSRLSAAPPTFQDSVKKLTIPMPMNPLMTVFANNFALQNVVTANKLSIENLYSFAGNLKISGNFLPLPTTSNIQTFKPTITKGILMPFGIKQTTTDLSLELNKMENKAVMAMSGEIRAVNCLLNDEHQTAFKVNPSELTVKLGDYARIEDQLTRTETIPLSGQVNFLNSDNTVVRSVQPYLLVPGSELQVSHGRLVQKHTVLGTLISAESKGGDIVQGLPKVDELLEAREPQHKLFTSMHAKLSTLFYQYGKMYGLREGCELSFQKIRQFLVQEVQDVYQSQGVYIGDKHVEIIVRQMTTHVVVIDPGKTGLLPGDIIDIRRIEQLEHEGSFAGVKYRPILLGITRAALMAESFISAASFQETKRVLAKAALEGQIDWLTGLKENVILGRLIPAGTGLY